MNRSRRHSTMMFIAFTDALGNETKYEYDALNRRAAIMEANGARTEYAYDVAGNPVRATDALGNVGI